GVESNDGAGAAARRGFGQDPHRPTQRRRRGLCDSCVGGRVAFANDHETARRRYRITLEYRATRLYSALRSRNRCDRLSGWREIPIEFGEMFLPRRDEEDEENHRRREN